MQDISVEPNKINLLRELKKRYKAARRDADLWSNLLEACYHYAIPYRNRFYRPKEFQGEQKNARIYDTTPIEAVKTFVSKMHSAMTPPQTQWGFLELDEEWFDEDIDPIDQDEAQQRLNKYMRILFSYIFQSNFDVVVNECYFDLAVGTACLVINSGTENNPLQFTSVSIDKLAIEEAFNGNIETWFRWWDDVKITELQLRWPKIEIPEDYLRDAELDPDAKLKCVYEGVMFCPWKKDKKKYVYAVWSDDNLMMSEWLESKPAIVWRYQKTNNETWGRGPVMDALPSIISLQEMARIEMAAANLNTFKPYMAYSDGVFNPHTFKLEPFAIIPIAPIGAEGQFPLQPLPDSSNPQFSQLLIQDLRNQINQLLFVTTDNSPSIQPESATEVQMQQQRLSEKIGPLFSRLQSEFLWPVIERVAYILDKMGLLQKPRFNDKLIKFKYKSPLALAKGQQDVARLAQFVQIIQGMFGEQATMMILNMKRVPTLMAEALQIDERYLNDPEQIEQVVQELSQMKAQGMIDENGMPPGQPQQ